MNSFQGLIAYFLLNIFSSFLRMIPLDASLVLGSCLGDLVFYVNKKLSRKVIMNLRLAYGKKKSSAELRRLQRQFFQVYGQSIIELARFPVIAKQGFARYVTVHGKEHFDVAIKKGKGVIFLSMHFGNWELSNLVGSMMGHPYNMVANDLEHINRVADFLNSLRRSAGCNIINPGIGGREIIKRLKANEIVTLVVDQGGKDGIPVPFFGEDASMSTGAVRLALKYDAAILLVNIYRLPHGKHVLTALPFELTRSADVEKDVQMNLKRMTGVYERWIDEHPYEYIWSYKTWKLSKTRTVVVLDDGRTGHLRQSEAVARLLEGELKVKGFNVRQEVVSLKFRSSFFPFLLGLVTGGKFLLGDRSVYFLKPFLSPDSFEKLACLKPDFVISAGARAATVNVWLAQDNRASNIAILRPGLVPLKHFSRVILPRHDIKNKKVPSCVVEVKAALNLIDKTYLDDNVKALENRFSHLKSNLRPKIGFLLGGDTKGLVMSEQQIRVVINQIKDAAQRFEMNILVTTSRRTSPMVEQLVSREFKDYERTALLIIANRSNVPEAVGGILGLSDVVVVSGESISMISEAACSGKKTVVFPIDGPNLKPIENKYTRFADDLSRQGGIVFSDTRSLASSIDGVLKGKIFIKPVNDTAVIKAALEGLVR
ncbi:MAG: mitochondrial fission ELM1 family protein [Candidatus Omnitrophica bacterium]|nr:mitochondrial fission ELM1 family protein [Candidatus Omnitrophota bacterium]